MTNYTYLGWGTTDSNGIAKLDHDADGEPIDHSYTGSGVGEVDVVASLDNPIVSGSVVSTPYEVLDTLFYDDGTETPTSSRYNITSGDTNVSVVTDGIKVERTSASSSSYCDIKINNSTSWRDSSKNYCIEADITFGRPSGSNGGAYALFGGQSVSIWDLTHQNSGSGHLKIETDGTTLKPYWEGTHISASDKTMSSTDGFRFQLYQASWVTFKNLKIYPI